MAPRLTTSEQLLMALQKQPLTRRELTPLNTAAERAALSRLLESGKVKRLGEFYLSQEYINTNARKQANALLGWLGLALIRYVNDYYRIHSNSDHDLLRLLTGLQDNIDTAKRTVEARLGEGEEN